MKRFVRACGVSILLFFASSCNKESIKGLVLKKSNSFSFIAPSGFKLPYSRSELTDIAESLSDSTNVHLTGIDYLDVKTGYVAIIAYETESGSRGNFALLNYPKVEYVAGKLEFKKLGNTDEIPGAANQLQQGDITVKCVGTCGCTVSGTIKPDGTITFKCGCEDCTAVIKGGL